MANDSENLQPWTIITTASVTALALVSVCIRLLSRYEKKQKLWWDDWMILWSMLWNLLVVGFIFGMVWCGMGIHAENVPVERIVLMAKLLVVAEILYVFNLVWTKLSLLLMYYRIFRFPYFKRWAYGIGTFIIMWVICITFLFIFICVPVQKLWYPQLPGRCINQVGTWIANAVSTIVSDFVTLILPIPQVWKLQLRKTEKIALTVAFSLGFFVIFASAYRFSVLFEYDAMDPTYTLARTVGWTAIEMSAGIVSACLPTMKPGVYFIIGKLGIKGSVRNLFRNTSSDGLSKTDGSNHSNGHATTDADTTTGHVHGRKGSQGAFYRLPDGSRLDGRDNDKNSLDKALRPEHGCVSTAASVSIPRGETDSIRTDEIPLHSIHVHKKFTQVTN